MWSWFYTAELANLKFQISNFKFQISNFLYIILFQFFKRQIH